MSKKNEMKNEAKPETKPEAATEAKAKKPAAKKTASPIVLAAADINLVLKPKPLLDTTVTEAELKKDIVELFPGIEDGDGLSEDTMTTLKKIGYTGKTRKAVEKPAKAAAAAGKTEAKAKRAHASDDTVYTFVKLPEKGPKQMVQILEVLKKKPLARAELLKQMEKVIETRQPIERILAFYHSAMVNGKLVTITAG